MEKDQNENLNKNLEDTKDQENSDNKEADSNEENNNTEEPKSAEERILELEDKITRTFAEMENQRRRFEKEKEEAFEYGGFSFAREALNLLDNLERSKISLENDETIKNTDTLKKVLEHFEIINKDLLSIFKKNNIEPIKSINEKLDPNLHQAMMEIEDDSKEPGIIIQEIQKGFMMKDRLLRPALVGVAKRKSEEQSNGEQKTQENQAEKDKN